MFLGISSINGLVLRSPLLCGGSEYVLLQLRRLGLVGEAVLAVLLYPAVGVEDDALAREQLPLPVERRPRAARITAHAAVGDNTSPPMDSCKTHWRKWEGAGATHPHWPLKPPKRMSAATTRCHGTTGAKGLLRIACETQLCVRLFRYCSTIFKVGARRM